MSRGVLFAVILSLVAAPLIGATHIWTGAVSERFSDAANWYGGSPAGDLNADLSFPTGSRLTAQNDLSALTVRSIAISGNNYSITGNAIGFTNAGEIIDSTGGPNLIVCDLLLTENLRVTTNLDFISTAGLTLSGVISGNGSLWVMGGGRLTFSGTGANTYTGITNVVFGSLLLKKPAHTDAIPAELRIGSSDSFGSPSVTTFSDEEIPDGAPITVDGNGSLTAAGIETIGPLRLINSASVAGGPGRLVLGADVTVAGNSGGTAQIWSGIVLPTTRTFSIESSGNRLSSYGPMTSGTPGAGVIVTGGGFSPDYPWYSADLTGTWDGPTIVRNSSLHLNNTHTAVTLEIGRFSGNAASLQADGGVLGPATLSGNVRLAPSVNNVINDLSAPFIQLNGTLDLAGAQLTLPNFGPETYRQLGKVYTLVSNSSAVPVVGTFAGLAEGALINNRWRLSYVGGDGNEITVTEVGTLGSSVALRANPTSVTVGDSVTFDAEVFVRSSVPVVPTGSVTFTSGTTVLGTAPLSGSTASITTAALPVGNDLVTATYSGSAQIVGSQFSTGVAVQALAPTVASVDPSTIAGGSTTTLTIHGSGFLEGGTVSITDAPYFLPLQSTTFVSSTELRVQYNSPFLPTDSQPVLAVFQPGPGGVHSNSFTLHVTAFTPPPPSPSPFTYGAQSVSLNNVTPGATTAWLSATRRPYGYSSLIEFGANLISDDDNDGQVTLQYDHPLPYAGLYAVADLSTRTIIAGSVYGNTVQQPGAFPAKAFLRDPDGNFTHLTLTRPNTYDFWLYLWARPGVGAWRKELFDGASLDLDRVPNGLLVFETSQMRPVDNSPPPPAGGVAAGDLFIGMDMYGIAWFGDRVDDHLAESGGTGVITFPSTYGAYANEKEGVAHVVLLRLDGTDGVVSVQYSTADGTAVAGTHYTAQAGSVTFNAGENLKTIDIPLTNDGVYSGQTSFTVQLSNPAGTTIRGPAASLVTIAEDELPPVLTLRPSVTSLPEGDSGTHLINVDVILQGATRKPVAVNWYWNVGDSYSSHSGQFVFAPGETQKTIAISYDANTVPEPDRVFTAGIGNADNATVGTSSSRITVVDDDFSTVSIADASIVESGGTAYLRLLVFPASKKPITVTFATSDGSATAGSDYVAKSATISSSDTISIPINNDSIGEGPEWFAVTLNSAQGARLGRSTAIVAIGDDDVPTFAGPSGLSATATGTTVMVSWLPVSGATSYEIQQSSGGRPFAPLSSTTLTSIGESGLDRDMTYLFRVRAVGANGTFSTYSATDAATTVVFSNEPLVAGVTVVQAIHFTQLRAAVNAMRIAAGLPILDFASEPLAVGSIIQSAHIGRLRGGLDQARAIIGLPRISYTYDLVGGPTVIRAVDVQEIRAGCR